MNDAEIKRTESLGFLAKFGVDCVGDLSDAELREMCLEASRVIPCWAKRLIFLSGWYEFWLEIAQVRIECVGGGADCMVIIGNRAFVFGRYEEEYRREMESLDQVFEMIFDGKRVFIHSEKNRVLFCLMLKYMEAEYGPLVKRIAGYVEGGGLVEMVVWRDENGMVLRFSELHK